MAGSGLGGDRGNVKSIFFHTFYHPTGPKAKCHQSNQRKGDRAEDPIGSGHIISRLQV